MALTEEERKERARVRQRRYYQEHREEVIERARLWRAEHLEECRERTRGYQRTYRPEHLEDCRATSRSISARAHREFQGFIVPLKVVTGCADCGFVSDPARLCFHHLPGETKLFNVAKAATRSRAAVLAEIEKCVVLCVACHNKRHAAQLKEAS